MSFVICCATSEYGIIASDGRMVDAETEEVIRDDYPKVVRVNDRLVIGFAGDADIAESAIEYARKRNCGRKAQLETITNSLRSFLQYASESGIDLCNTCFYVLGINKDGMIAFSTTSSINGIKTSFSVPEENGGQLIAFFGCSLRQETAAQVRAVLQCSPDALGLRRAIHIVAETHPTVVKQVYIQSIRHERIHPHKERSDTSCP